MLTPITTPETSEHSIASVLQTNFTIGGLEADFHGLTFQDTRFSNGAPRPARPEESNPNTPHFVPQRYERNTSLDDGYGNYSVDHSDLSRRPGHGYTPSHHPVGFPPAIHQHQHHQAQQQQTAIRMAPPALGEVFAMQRNVMPLGGDGPRIDPVTMSRTQNISMFNGDNYQQQNRHHQQQHGQQQQQFRQQQQYGQQQQQQHVQIQPPGYHPSSLSNAQSQAQPPRLSPLRSPQGMYAVNGLVPAIPAPRRLQRQNQPQFSRAAPGRLTGRPLQIVLDNPGATLEDIVAAHCEDILRDASRHSLKAVELANTLRARVGQETLVAIRERCEGMLSLLERYPKVFIVDRIPKNDCVSLRSPSVKQLRDKNGSVPVSASRTLSRSEPVIPTSSSSPQPIGSVPSLVAIINGFTPGGQSPAPYPSLGYVKDTQASNCLHIGNVPLNVSEIHLRKEFEAFGDIECLNIVTQRTRRFAFVSYYSIDDAILAKQRLSRMHPWKNAISFARKDHSKQVYSIPPPVHIVESLSSEPIIKNTNTLPRKTDYVQRFHSTPKIIRTPPLDTESYVFVSTEDVNGSDHGSAVGTYGPRYPPLSPNEMRGLGLGLGQEIKQPSFLRPPPANNHMGSSSEEDEGGPEQQNHAPKMNYSVNQSMQDPVYREQQEPRQHFPLSMHPLQTIYESNGAVHDIQQGSSGSSCHQPLKQVQTHAVQPQEAGADAAQLNRDTSQFDERILQRLCDDTYVPTQRWLANRELDAPFCSAIASQLMQLGGEATVSKLRSSLRSRISAQSNIKSVALKAFLEAYPEYFTLQNNHVNLALLSHEDLDPI